MKKMILVILSILFLAIASVSFADPFLGAARPTEAITQTQIEVTQITPVPPTVTIVTGIFVISGTDVKVLDLGPYAIGTYKFRMRWATTNNWWSDYSDPFDAGKPGKGGLKIIP